MKTNFRIIPFALLLALLFGTQASAEDFVLSDKDKSIKKEQSQKISDGIRGPILSTKMYKYEQELINTKTIQLILITNDSKISLNVDENGEYHNSVERFRNGKIESACNQDTENITLLEKLRRNVKNFIVDGYNDAIDYSATENEEPYVFDDLRDDKYFKSEYENEINENI